MVNWLNKFYCLTLFTSSFTLVFSVNDDEAGLILGLPITVFIGLVITIFLICLVCVLSLAAYLCKREQQLHQQQQRIALHQASTPANYTGTRKNLSNAFKWLFSFFKGNLGVTFNPFNQRFATLPLEKLREPPSVYPGNLYTPAAGIENSNNNLLNHHLVENSTAPSQLVYYTTKWPLVKEKDLDQCCAQSIFIDHYHCPN